MAGGIFDALGVKVTESKFPCTAPPGATERYAVTVLVLLPPAAASQSPTGRNHLR